MSVTLLLIFVVWAAVLAVEAIQCGLGGSAAETISRCSTQQLNSAVGPPVHFVREVLSEAECLQLRSHIGRSELSLAPEVDGEPLENVDLDQRAWAWLVDKLDRLVQGMEQTSSRRSVNWLEAREYQWTRRADFVPHVDGSWRTLVVNISPDQAYKGGELLIFGARGEYEENLCRACGPKTHLDTIKDMHRVFGVERNDEIRGVLRGMHSDGVLANHSVGSERCGDAVIFDGDQIHTVLPVYEGVRHTVIATYSNRWHDNDDDDDGLIAIEHYDGSYSYYDDGPYYYNNDDMYYYDGSIDHDMYYYDDGSY